MGKYLLHPKMSHLTDEQVDAMMDAFYSGEKVSILTNRFGIDLSTQAFSKYLPATLIDCAPCPNCGASMVAKPPSRHSGLSVDHSQITCSQCQHAEVDLCACVFCFKRRKEARLALLSAQHSLIRDLCRPDDKADPKRKASDISMATAVALLALARTSEMVEHRIYRAIANHTMVPYAPQGNWGNDLLLNLWNDCLVYPSPESDPRAFEFSGSGLKFLKVELIDWIHTSDDTNALVLDIERCCLFNKWPQHWHKEVCDLRYKLAIAECTEYYLYCLMQRHLPNVIGPQVEVMLSNLLHDFSVSQCFSIIWKGAQQASDFKLRNNVNSRHAANSMLGACQRYADRARAEGWKIKGFQRNFDCSRSMVSHVLYDVFMRMGEKGFSEPLSKS